MTRSLLRNPLVLAVCGLALWSPLTDGVAVAQRDAPRVVPYQEFADRFLARHELEVTPVFDGELRALLDRDYLRISLGPLDVRYPPAALKDAAAATQLKTVVTHMLVLLGEWNAWTGGAGQLSGEHLTALRKWVGSWKKKQMVQAGRKGGGDLLAQMKPGDAALAALRALATASRGQATSDDDIAADESAPTSSSVPAQRPELGSVIVLAPTRQEFLEWCCFLGTLDEQNKGIFWQGNVYKRAETWVEYPMELQIVAMEYASPQPLGDGAEYFVQGLDMNARETTGLQQHVVQNAAASLLRDQVDGSLDPAFEAGLIQNLTIAVCGENNTRSGGDGKGKSAAAVSVFVPGGNSMGGALAGANLDSRWRAMRGKLYFLRTLRREQKRGAKKAPDKSTPQAHFLLEVAGERDTHVIRAPFLGLPAKNPTPVAEEFVDDFREFHRAYRSAFVRWLRTAAAGGKQESVAAFAKLLAALSDGRDIEKACVEIYSIPLSANDPEPPSLEWSFLEWLRTTK